MKNEKTLENTFSNLKKTFKYAQSRKLYLFLILLCNIVMTTCAIIIPILTAKEIINLTDNLWEQLLIVLITLFGVKILKYCIIIF